MSIPSFLGHSRWAVAANTLTISRILLAPVLAGLILYQNPWWVTFIMGWVIGGTDYVDGELARQAEPTRVGAFLDPLADKVLMLFSGFALVFIGRFWWFPMTLMAVREVGIQLYRSYWARRSLAIPARKLAKYKTLVQGLAIAAALFPPLESQPAFADFLLWIAVGFTLFTAGQYIWDGQKAMSSTGSL